MLPPELANPFRRPPAVPLNPDTAGFVEDMLGKEARKAFEALDDEPKKPKEKPQEPTEEEKAAMRQAQERLEISRELLERFPTWKTIKIGEHNTPEEMRKALEDGGFKINKWARQILEKTSFSGIPIYFEFVNLSV